MGVAGPEEDRRNGKGHGLIEAVLACGSSVSQWGEEPEEDRREGKEDLPDETVSAYGLWVSHAGKMGNTVGADESS